MKDGVLCAMFAIGCMTLLECAALIAGIDGQLFASVIAAIGVMAGYVIKGQALPSKIMAKVRGR
jgi:hypothetical protein